MPLTLSLLLASFVPLLAPVQPADCGPADAAVRVGPATMDVAETRLLRCVRADLQRGAWADADARLARARAAASALDGRLAGAWLGVVDRLVATRVVDARAWDTADGLAAPLRASTPWLATAVEALATARSAWSGQDADAFARALAAARGLSALGAGDGDVEVLRMARLVQATVAGGQYERDEMQLLVDEANASERALGETLGERFVPVVIARELEADLLLQMNRDAAAADIYRALIEAHPGRVQPWLGLGLAYRHLGHGAEADRCQAEARRLAPGFAFDHAPQ